jgi:phage protein D
MGGASAPTSRVTDLWIRCGSAAPVADHEIRSVAVDLDLDQPAMCALGLSSATTPLARAAQLGDEVEVRVGGPGGAALFVGEVAGLEPTYRTGGESGCVIRAFDRLHRLLRGRRSRTFVDRRDSDMARAIAGDHGLEARVDPSDVVHPHVYQHNQSDLDFLRDRAARIGHELAVEDRTLLFRRPRADRDSGLVLSLDDPDAELLLTGFSPRLSSAGVVSEVEVRGWDAARKREIVARARAGSSSLGPTTGARQSERGFGRRATFVVDRPVTSVEEAQAIAEAQLRRALLGYISGDGTLVGSPKIRPGIVVEIVVDAERPDDRFNGRYLVVGTTHRYCHSDDARGGGYTTAIRVRRDAEGC